MNHCVKIKTIARNNEKLADFFSLMAVSLLFASLWISMEYYSYLIDWVAQKPLLHFPAFLFLIALDVVLMLVFLSIGSVSHHDNMNESCFRTFAGRRHGAGSFGAMFGSWLSHMEKHNGHKHR